MVFVHPEWLRTVCRVPCAVCRVPCAVYFVPCTGSDTVRENDSALAGQSATSSTVSDITAMPLEMN